MNVGGGFLQRQQDSSYVQRTIDGAADLMLSEELSVGAPRPLGGCDPFRRFIACEQHPTECDDSQSARTFCTTREMICTAPRPEPGTGSNTATEDKRSLKRLHPPVLNSGESPLQRLVVDLDFFVPAFARQVIAFGLHGYEVRGDEMQESDMFRFGGARTLRGYRENQFLGSRVAWTNAEYRFLLGRRSFLFGFLDSGYYFRPADPEQDIPAADGFKYGYGIGLRTDTPLGNISVSFALGQGDSFSQGKIHIGLINDF